MEQAGDDGYQPPAVEVTATFKRKTFENTTADITGNQWGTDVDFNNHLAADNGDSIFGEVDTSSLKFEEASTNTGISLSAGTVNAEHSGTLEVKINRPEDEKYNLYEATIDVTFDRQQKVKFTINPLSETPT